MDNKKCKRLIKGILIGFFLITMLLPVRGETILKSELFENETFRTRLWLKFPAWSLNCLGLVVYKPGKPVYRMAGIETPFLCFGPVTLGGLLKEVRNPLGYQANSSIHQESSRIFLNSAFQSKEQLGLVLGPFGFLPAFFIITKSQTGLDSRPVPESWGCITPLVLNKSLQMDLLWINAPPDATDEGSDLNAHKNLSSWAFRSRFKENFPGGSLSAALTMALNTSRINDTGYFCTLQGALETPWFKAHGLWGAASLSYLTVEYNSPDLWQRAEVDGAIRFHKEGWLEGRYSRCISPSSDSEENTCYPTKENFVIKGQINLPFKQFISKAPSLMAIFIAAESQITKTWDKDGVREAKRQSEAEVRFELPPCRISINYQYKNNDNAKADKELQIYCGCCSPIGECALKLDQDFPGNLACLPPTLELNAALKFSYTAGFHQKKNVKERNRSLNWSRLYLKVKREFSTKSEYESLVTLGWEVHSQ